MRGHLKRETERLIISIYDKCTRSKFVKTLIIKIKRHGAKVIDIYLKLELETIL